MVKSNIPFFRLRKTVNSLPARQRAILLEDLYKTTWQTELKQLFKRIDKTAKSRVKPNDAEIKKEVDAAREEIYARRRR